MLRSPSRTLSPSRLRRLLLRQVIYPQIPHSLQTGNKRTLLLLPCAVSLEKNHPVEVFHTEIPSTHLVRQAGSPRRLERHAIILKPGARKGSGKRAGELDGRRSTHLARCSRRRFPEFVRGQKVITPDLPPERPLHALEDKHPASCLRRVTRRHANLPRDCQSYNKSPAQVRRNRRLIKPQRFHFFSDLVSFSTSSLITTPPLP